MDIFIPKFKPELYIKDGHIGMSQKVYGEYRAVLMRSDGTIKHDSGWKPNLLTNLGLNLLAAAWKQPYGFNQNAFDQCYVGTSDTPVDYTQNSLQGSNLGSSNSKGTVYNANAGAPDYQRITIRQDTFNAGTATGLIKEFVYVYYTGSPTGGATIRCVLDVPINKGPSDQLTLQHRLTIYPDLLDKTGTIDISGTPYNYTIRHTFVQWVPAGHPTTLVPLSTMALRMDGASLGLITGSPTGTAHSGNPEMITPITGGGSGPGTWYADVKHVCRVDDFNGTIRTFEFGYFSYPWNSIGLQWRIGKVSDDSALVKENTHEFTFSVRHFPLRWEP